MNRTKKDRTHLTFACRVRIEELYHNYKNKKTEWQIAKIMGRDYKTIKNEIRNNGIKLENSRYHYDAKEADMKAFVKRLFKNKKIANKKNILENNEILLAKLIKHLQDKNSPEVSSYLLKQEGYFISHESIYLYIYKDKAKGGKLYEYLPIRRKKRKKRGNKNENRGRIKNAISIKERGKEADLELGNWEGDLVSYKDGYIVSLLERKSNFPLIRKVKNKKSKEVREAIEKTLKEYKGSLLKSITFDRGLEFSEHIKLSENLDCKVYFCDAYSSWQKGKVENVNKFIRRFINKKEKLSDLTSSMIKCTEKRIQNYPRRMFGFKSSSEVFQNLVLLDLGS